MKIMITFDRIDEVLLFTCYKKSFEQVKFSFVQFMKQY